MASSPVSIEVVRFEDYEANLRSRELRHNGVTVRLPDQSFEVLVMLLECPGELVTREEIQKRLWSADMFVDFDHGLNNAVNRLRDALGDSAEVPHFVETLPRRGYRFIGRLQPAVLSGSNGKTSQANHAVSSRTKISKLSLAWIGVIASLLLAWLAFSAVRRLVIRSDQQVLAIRSIAVLPLENLSADPSQDYFADGITEQLITELGQVNALRVISHTSVNQYKATKKTVPVIARELQVDAVVEGTVTRSQGRVRVTANLVQANPEKHLWAETYDRDMRDVLSLQSEVSQAIARAVRVELTPKERESFANLHPVDLEAQEAYLKGLSHFVRGKDQLFIRNEGKQELHQANDFFQQAIKIDSQYALAYAGLARSNIWLSILESPALDAARVASDRAILLDENLAEPHMVRGGLLLNRDPDWASAEREFLRSIELNPSSAEGHQGYGIYLSLRGRFDQATAEMDRAVMLDPIGRSAKTQAAWIDVCAGNYDKAITRLQNITELFPNDALSHEGLGIANVLRGRFEEGIAELTKSTELKGKDPNRSPDLGWAYAMSGKRDQALQILNEVQRESTRDADTEYQVALIYAGLGDNDQVFTWLDKAYRDRHDVLNEVWREPQLISLRTDRRLRQLAHKLGIIG